VYVELRWHPRRRKAPGVLDVFVPEDVELADLDIGRRQPAEVRRPCRRGDRRHIIAAERRPQNRLPGGEGEIVAPQRERHELLDRRDGVRAYAEHGKTVLKGCSSCHHGQGMGKVACVDCHRSQEAMFSGKAIKGIAETPDAMWGKVSCPQCHTRVKRAEKETVKAIKAACSGCHEKGYADQVDDWVAASKKLADKYAVLLPGLEKELTALETQEGRHSVPLRARYDEMDNDARFVLSGGWYHNPQYGEAIAARIDKDSAALRSMIEVQKEGKSVTLEK